MSAIALLELADGALSLRVINWHQRSLARLRTNSIIIIVITQEPGRRWRVVSQ